jgi:hypothetical protein
MSINLLPFFKIEVLPQPLHQNDAHSFLFKLFNGTLQGKYKYQTKATSPLTEVATPTRLMKGVIVTRPHARTSPTHIIRNRRPHWNAIWRVRNSNLSSKPWTHTTTLAREVAATIFRWPIFRKDQSDDLVKPDVDASTTLNNATTLHIHQLARVVASETPRHHAAESWPLTQLWKTKPLHLLPLWPVAALKTMPSRGRATYSVAIIRSGRPRSRVSPEVAWAKTRELWRQCLQQGNRHRSATIACHEMARFSPAAMHLHRLIRGVATERTRWKHGDHDMPRPETSLSSLAATRTLAGKQPWSLSRPPPLPPRWHTTAATHQPSSNRQLPSVAPLQGSSIVTPAAAPCPNPWLLSYSGDRGRGGERGPATDGADQGFSQAVARWDEERGRGRWRGRLGFPLVARRGRREGVTRLPRRRPQVSSISFLGTIIYLSNYLDIFVVFPRQVLIWQVWVSDIMDQNTQIPYRKLALPTPKQFDVSIDLVLSLTK